MHHPTHAGHLAVLTAPLAGHIGPIEALASSLGALGWRVSLVHVGQAAGLVRSGPMRFAALPHSPAETYAAYLQALRQPTGPLRLARMIRAVSAMTELLLEQAPPLISAIGATAILADAVEPAGPLIADHLRLPHAVAVTGLPLFEEPDIPPPFVGWRYRSDALGRYRNRHAYAIAKRWMRPADRVLQRHRARWQGDEPPTSPRIQVAQCPKVLDFPRRSLPANFLYGSPWRQDAPAEVPIAVDRRPLIFCSLGTLQGRNARLFAIIAAACARIGARAVIAHGGGLSEREAGDLPGDPLVFDFVPQPAVLRLCAAAVVHGGFNTVLDTLGAGIPMVLLPIAFEQPATAARVARLGAGLVLSPRGVGPASLARALRAVLEQPGYRAAAQAVARDMASGGGAPAAAAAINEAFAPPS